MKCFKCGSKMEYRFIVKEICWGENRKTVNSEAYVCDNCDWVVFEPEEARRLQNIAAGRDKND